MPSSPLAHVESRERDVPGLEERQRAVRLEDLRVDTQGARRGDERIVRRTTPVGDDGELHGGIMRAAGRGMGVDPVTQLCRSRYAFATGSSR